MSEVEPYTNFKQSLLFEGKLLFPPIVLFWLSLSWFLQTILLKLSSRLRFTYIYIYIYIYIYTHILMEIIMMSSKFILFLQTNL